MTEFASHHLSHRDESRCQIPKSSTSNLSTSRRLAETWSDSRILAQTMDKMDSRSKHYASMSKEVNRRSLPASGDISYKRNVDEKPNGLLEDYKIVRKSEIRPSDSSYTRKLSWDTSNSAEATSSIVHSSKSHHIREIKQDCHVATKHQNKTIADSHRKKSDLFYINNRKTVENVDPPPYFPRLSKTEHVNGISHDSHSNSLSIYRTANQTANGFGHSEINHSLSRDSSHSQSHGPEANNLVPAPHKRHPDLERKSFYTRKRSPVQSQNHGSPVLNYVPHNNLVNERSTSSSQRMVVAEESSSRPNSSFWGDEENSNEEKSLSVNLSNPATNNPANTSTPEKPRYPYSIEMKEGMFKTVKEGPDYESLRIHIIENFGSGDLRDGGFSWGWSIEQRSSAQPSPKTSSSSREKNSSSANKDIHKSKRRLEYEKISSSPTSKKSKVKSSSSEGRDEKGNKEKSSKVSVETKEIRSKSDHVSTLKQSSSHTKQNCVQGEKPASKPSKSTHDLHAEIRKSLNVGRSQNSDKHCEYAISPIQRKKSPSTVPSSEMILQLPKTDCLGKNSNVIDDSTMGFISSRKERSAVYSGRKSTLEVLSLKVMCSEAVKKNILSLKIGRNVPFELLMPILKLCTPTKILKIEEHNKHIVRHTDCLWRKFCESDFREEKRFHGETWKDVYWRAKNLRDMKLKNLAASISNGMAKAHPERQAKYCGVGTSNPEKRQRKGKVEEVHKIEEIPIPRPETNGKGSGSSASHKEPPTKKRSGSESSSSNSPQSAQKPITLSKSQVPKAAKKTLAPLMSKTKKMLSFVNRRR